MVNEDVSAVVQEVVERHGKERDSLIPILNEINHELGYLPTEAIKGERRKPHVIDPETCVRCGICMQVCNFNAVVVK